MSKLYACIISTDIKRDRGGLIAVARQFAYSIELIEDGILFDVSGLERLIGGPGAIAQKIKEELRGQNIPALAAIAETVETAIMLARQSSEKNDVVYSSDAFRKLPLGDLPIEQDTLNVFTDLGIRNIESLLEIPREELVGRYGGEFERIIDIAEQKGPANLIPNVKEEQVLWEHILDFPVEDFEQLIFLLNRGLEKLFGRIAGPGLSTEHLDISFGLSNRTVRSYEIRASFPTLDRSFWLKLISLRVSLDPPESGILSVKVAAYFTRPRSSQSGLYAVARPEPESLLLTVNKLKNLVGETNVGVPVVVDQRLAEPFVLDPEAIPKGNEHTESSTNKAVMTFNYFRPPLRVKVVVKDGRLSALKARDFEGKVVASGGVWKNDSRWWEKPWKTEEWDVEIENQGVYRLCRNGTEWFLTGEYD